MAIAITCTQCGKIGLIDENAVDLDEGKLDVQAFVAPEGFRKVMFGMSSAEVDLYCIDCGISAELPTMH
ncbi:hypothetical protein H3V53_03565 [Paraburkholderia bengalensis]|uniref:Uncharacterized protein n=1 Tax=Paraburkholderia bengalensis TaxID=2747562 RepID=A0ABU8ILB7_9BURK